MPAKSRNQMIAARVALAAKKGKKGAAPKGASEMMMKMSEKDLKEMTKMKKDMPKKKMKGY